MKRTLILAAILITGLATWTYGQQAVRLFDRLDEANDAVSIYGSDDAGTTKRIIKTDSTGAITVDVESTPSLVIGTFPDNEPFNVAQINGVTPLMGAGNTGTGSPRVTIASDNAPLTIRGANSNAKINCTENAFLNMTTATTTEIVALSGSTRIYVCHYSIISNGGTATTVKFVGGTGTNCATSQDDRSAGIPLTAATNTVGISAGSGEGMILKTSTDGDALCVTSSGNATIGVNVSFAQY
jgi:hypothetical protein